MVVGAVVLALGLAACGPGDESGSGGSSAGGSASPSLGAVERAQAALMTSDELPVARPGTVVDAGLGYTAEGDQVSMPWGQVWLCAGTGRPDEGPQRCFRPNLERSTAWKSCSGKVTNRDGRAPALQIRLPSL